MSDYGPSIVCPLCGFESHHPEDVRRRYCARCHVFHDDVPDDARSLSAVALALLPSKAAAIADKLVQLYEVPRA